MKRKSPTTPKKKARKRKAAPDDSCTLQVRLSKGQRKLFRAMAKAKGLDLSGWVRSTLLREASNVEEELVSPPREIPSNGVETMVQIPVEEMG